MDNEILARVYGPRDLEPHLLAAGIDQTVLVQAAATVEETEYMLGIADASSRIAGVVGWIDSKIKSTHIICAGWPNTQNFWASAQ
jgi:L-fuconolactonase